MNNNNNRVIPSYIIKHSIKNKYSCSISIFGYVSKHHIAVYIDNIRRNIIIAIMTTAWQTKFIRSGIIVASSGKTHVTGFATDQKVWCRPFN